MKKEFNELLRSVGAQGNYKYFYTKVFEAYQKPERFYHTFKGHIAFCFKELEKVPADIIEDAAVLKVALLLHDVIMDFKRTDNEEKSAEFALELLKEMGVSDYFGWKVADLILATKHDALPKNNDAKIIIDIDLAIFGQGAQTFDDYEKNIRKEYSFVLEDVFKTHRAIVLQQFIDRRPIYQTAYFRNKYEFAARVNLIRSLSKL